MTVRILVGDCRDLLRAMEPESVHCAVTSPPYYGLRDYKIESSTWPDGWVGTLGLEPDWRLYLEHVVEVFREVRRVLRRDGTLWLNMGDTYASATQRGNGGYGTSGLTNGGEYQDEVPRPAFDLGGAARKGANLAEWSAKNARGGGHKAAQVNEGWARRPPLGETSQKRRRPARDGIHAGKHGYALNTVDPKSAGGSEQLWQPNRTPQPGFKPKDRMMMPARVAIALQDDGWWLRDEVVWHKPNPMPSSVDDRTTPAHEMLYLLTPSARYYYDAVAIEEAASYGPDSGMAERPKGYFGGARVGADEREMERPFRAIRETRNKRSVWTIATQPFPEAHFATFPPDLVEPLVKAGTSARGCCPRCAAPWRRVTAEVETGKTQKMPAGMAIGVGSHDVVEHNAAGRPVAPDGNAVTATVTLGWWPTCRCDGLGDLPPHPRKPGRAEIPDEAAYKLALAAWRKAVAEVDARRAGMCDAARGVRTVPAVVLDPFGGAGTVGLVADRLQRSAMLLERNPDYAEMARRRIADDAPLFAGAAE